MKVLFFILLVIPTLVHAGEDTSAWGDIKSGTMKVIRGASKGVKKAASRVEEKIEENQKEDEAEERAERQQKK